jgi:hypothetical protein
MGSLCYCWSVFEQAAKVNLSAVAKTVPYSQYLFRQQLRAYTNVMACKTIDAAATASNGPQNVCRPCFELIWQDSPKRNETPVMDSATARNTIGIDHPII